MDPMYSWVLTVESILLWALAFFVATKRPALWQRPSIAFMGMIGFSGATFGYAVVVIISWVESIGMPLVALHLVVAGGHLLFARICWNRLHRNIQLRRRELHLPPI